MGKNIEVPQKTNSFFGKYFVATIAIEVVNQFSSNYRFRTKNICSLNSENIFDVAFVTLEI